MKPLTLVQAVNDALMSIMRVDDTVVVYGEDAGYEGGVFRATLGLQKEFGEDRCFDSPLAESAIAGTALGMAVAGLKPVIEMQFSGFFYPAINQVISHISRYRNRTQGAMTVPMVIRMPYGGGVRALEHHSESMEALFGHIPGIKVVIPSTPYDAKGLLIAAIRDPDPVIFMEPKRIYRSVKQQVPEEVYEIPLEKAKIIYEGSDITLAAYGAQMNEAMEAASQLKREGISVELIDLRTIYPYDTHTLIESVKKTGRFLTVHEGPESFGTGAELVARISDEAFVYLQAPPSRLAGFDTIVPLPKGEKFYMIGTKHIMQKIRELAAYQP